MSLVSEDGRHVLETGRADRSVWLMKCPPVVSRSWQLAATKAAAASSASDSVSSSSSSSALHPVVAKVVLSLDPLSNDDSSSLQFKMELAKNEIANTPKSYSLNMFKDFVPMCVFSESNQGKFSLEGKVEHKFDMEPHSENFGEYGKLCRERTNKANYKTRQTQVIDNDNGLHMRPLPGMIGTNLLGSKDKRKATPTKASDTKRTRRDRRELENIIFKLFERQPNWALKQLIIETDQPEPIYLKPIFGGPRIGPSSLSAHEAHLGHRPVRGGLHKPPYPGGKRPRYPRSGKPI